MLFGRLLLGILYASIAVAILVAVMFAISVKDPSSSRPSRVPRYGSGDPSAGSKVILGGTTEVIVVISDTPELRERGLSGREKLAANEGMLFVFEEPRPYGFWMKDMRFSIDIIWFDQNRKIIDVWESAHPSSYPKVFTPRAPAQFVLEVPAGFFANHNLKIGNTIEIL